MWLGGILLLAGACRLAGIGDRLVLDEGYTWLVARASSADVFLDRLAAFENTPPLYYLLVAPFDLDAEVWLRWPALVAGVATVGVTYAIAGRLGGPRAGLLAALVLAVLPYQVAMADLARGFMPATLGLSLAVLGALGLVSGSGRRSWLLYVGGGILALWSEYYTALTLMSLCAGLLAMRTASARRVLAAGIAPFLTMLPWAWEFKRSLDLDGVTKVLPSGDGLSVAVLRDELVPLFLGDRGAAATRSLILAGMVAVAATVVWILRKREAPVWLVAWVAAGTVVAHLIVSLAGPGVFESRYLIVLAPLAVTMVALAVVELGRRWLPAAVAAICLVLAGGLLIERTDREIEPDYDQIARVVQGIGARLVLTNSPVVKYYVHATVDVRLDRPFGLGPGDEADVQRPYAVADDSEVGNGPRPGPGRIVDSGRIVVRVNP